MTRSRLLWYAASLAFLFALIGLWNWIAALGIVSPVFLPAPGLAFRSILSGLSSGDLLEKFMATVLRMALGWFLASIVGIVIGAIVGSSRRTRAYLGATLEALRPLPASAVMPVAIALFGLNETMVLSVVAFGASWPLLLSTMHGFRKVEPRLFEVARILGISRLSVAWKIALPSALPDIMAGARLGLTSSLALAVAGEMLAGVDGLGQWIIQTGRMFRAADVFAGVLLLAVIGIISATLLGLAEHRLLRWTTLQR